MAWTLTSWMPRRWVTMAIMPVALVVVAACAGPVATPGVVSLSATGTAVIRGGAADEVYFLGRGAVLVTRIDDTDVVDADNNPLYGVIEVYPGMRDIRFIYRYAALCVATAADCAITLSRSGRLALNALPGHVYRVVATYKKGGLRAWIIDETASGQVVAGSRGSGADWAAGIQGIGSVHQF